MYNVQFCPCGHVGSVIPGSEMERKCKEREAKGFIDALILDSKGCPTCVSDKLSKPDPADYEWAWRENDPEHRRLFQEGWRWSTNLGEEDEDVDEYVAGLLAKGFETYICGSAYDVNGGLIPHMVSCWIKELVSP